MSLLSLDRSGSLVPDPPLLYFATWPASFGVFAAYCAQYLLLSVFYVSLGTVLSHLASWLSVLRSEGVCVLCVPKLALLVSAMGRFEHSSTFQ